MSTRLDLQNRLNLFFNNTTYYDTQSLNDSLQDGTDEIAAFSGCIYKSANIPFGQYTTYYDLLTLLPDYIGVVAVWNNTIRRWLFPQSLKKFNQVRIDWDTAYGTPYYFSPVNHRYMAIYMKPSVPNYGNMFVFYRASAPTLTDTVQIPIPDEHLVALESYSITDLWEQAQEWGKAQEQFKTYVSQLEALRVLMRSQRNRDRIMSLR